MEDDIKDARDKFQEAVNHATSFQRIVAKLEGKRIEARAKEESVKDLEFDLKEMTDSDDELKTYLDQYEERVALYQEEMETQKQHYNELTQAVDRHRQLIGQKQGDVGRYEAQRDQFNRQLHQREQIVKETARRHKIRGYDLEIDSVKVSDFVDRIAKMAREHQALLERARQESQEELYSAQKVLSQLNERKSALNHAKASTKNQLNINDQKIVTIQKDLDAFEIDEGTKVLLESKVEETKSRLNKAKSTFESATWDVRIGNIQQDLHSINLRKEKLDTEIIQGSKEASDSARLDFLNKEVKDRRRGLQTMKDAHSEKISKALEEDWEISSLDRTFQASLDRRTTVLQEAEAQRDGTQRELDQVQSKLTISQNELKKKKQEQKDIKEKIRSVLNDEPSEFEEALQNLEANVTILRQDQSSFKNLEKYYRDCLETANRHNVCRLCKRVLADKDKPVFLKHLEKAISRAAQDAVNEELEVAEEELKAMRELRGDYDAWSRLKDREIPALQTDCTSLDKSQEGLLTAIELHDKKVSEKLSAKRELDSVAKTVQNINKYTTDIKSLNSQLEELTAQFSQSGKSRGLEAVQDELKMAKDESIQLQSQLTALLSERDRDRATINSLELSVRDADSELNAATYQLREKSNLANQIDDLRRLCVELREEISRADSELHSLSPEIAKAQAKYDDIAASSDEKERELQQEASRLAESRNRLQLADQEIKAYVNSGGAEHLEKARREIENLENELSRIEAKQREITIEVKKIEEQLRNHNETKRSINDNLRYRRDARSLKVINAEIKELENHNAEVDKEKYDREANKWQMELNRLSSKQATMFGELTSKDNQLQQLTDDWDTAYSDAAYKYRESHIKVEATKAAIEDLGRYAGALDNAIMKFHSLKMEEINRIIEELWKRTYQGTDVDTILIRSDNEGAKGNKSYNYRVCMVKQDAEMDMRGRCSAGQKVLASIIIRLALAECFGVNCGLIALDEPTTNLDRDNIRALAEALAEIIRVRKAQSNFQLIVITHDEEFLRYMECSEFCDYYYRISRSERQKSIIERQSIAEVRYAYN